MMSFIILVVAIAGAHAACPYDYNDRIMNCLDPLSNLAYQGQHPNICGAMESATRCMNRLANMCWDNAFVTATVDGFHGVSDDVAAMCAQGIFKRSTRHTAPSVVKRGTSNGQSTIRGARDLMKYARDSR